MPSYHNYDAKWTRDELDDYNQANQAAYPPPNSAWLKHILEWHAQQAQPSKNKQTIMDAVRQPAHYARFVIEPATFNAANNLPFDVGNVVKYVCRFDAKNGREDLKKASRYIEMIIERLDREDRVKAGEDAAAVWSKML